MPNALVTRSQLAGPQVFTSYVKDMHTPDAKEYEVNLNKPDCCHYVRMHLQPCQHMVPVFVKRDMFATRRSRNDENDQAVLA